MMNMKEKKLKTPWFVSLFSSLALLLFSLLPLAGRAEDLRDLPLDHWANPVLSRFEARGWLRLPEARPYLRAEVAKELTRALKKYRSGTLRLSGADAFAFRRLVQEFMPDTAFDPQRLVETDLLRLGNEKTFLRGDLALAGIAQVSKGSKPNTQGRASMDLWGSTGKRFVFDERFTGILEKEKIFEQKVSPTLTTWRGGEFLTDWSYFRFQLPWFSLSLGRSEKWWGTGRFGTLLLSDNAQTFDAMDLRYSYRWLDFRSFAGILSADSGRYFSGHRLGVSLPHKVDLGASEVVVYQSRHPVPAYLNPLLPYYAVQHNERGDDNILWALDASWRPGGGTKWYGELLMDDVIYQQGETPAPQKLGFLGGLHWSDPLRLPDTDFKAEYAGIEKWVYTHRRSGNRYVGADTTQVLGHWLGTDGEALDLRLEHRFHPRLNLGLGFSQTRHGEGEVGIPWFDGIDDPHTAFLSGVVERRSEGRLYLDWRPCFWVTVLADGAVGEVKNAGRVPGPTQNISSGSLSVGVDF